MTIKGIISKDNIPVKIFITNGGIYIKILLAYIIGW